jgi:hypothetical protein
MVRSKADVTGSPSMSQKGHLQARIICPGLLGLPSPTNIPLW